MGNNRFTINEIIKSLTSEQRAQLRYAHSAGVSSYVKLKNNQFIGVHCNGIRNLSTLEYFNDWYFGDIIILEN